MSIFKDLREEFWTKKTITHEEFNARYDQAEKDFIELSKEVGKKNYFFAEKHSVDSFIKDTEKQIRELEDKISVLKKTAIPFKERREYLNAIENGWAKGNKEFTGFTWQESNDYYYLHTPSLDFGIKLKERKELKKYKWEVKVSSSKTIFWYDGGKEYKYDVLKEKYGWAEDTLTMKFITLEEAVATIDEWKGKILLDFAVDLGVEKRMIVSAKEYREALKDYLD